MNIEINIIWDTMTFIPFFNCIFEFLYWILKVVMILLSLFLLKDLFLFHLYFDKRLWISVIFSYVVNASMIIKTQLSSKYKTLVAKCWNKDVFLFHCFGVNGKVTLKQGTETKMKSTNCWRFSIIYNTFYLQNSIIQQW